jgi:hypothetical protein
VRAFHLAVGPSGVADESAPAFSNSSIVQQRVDDSTKLLLLCQTRTTTPDSRASSTPEHERCASMTLEDPA